MVERKVDSESRAFQRQWVTEYMFTDIAGKPVCLFSRANVAVIKEFNLRRHYETKRQDKLKNLNADEAVVKASLIVAEEIAKSARPFTTLKSCMMTVCDVLCPDKTQILANVSLRRNTIADRVCEMATDLRTQLCERSKNFIAYSLAVDESTDMMDIAQLAIFIRGEEILNIKSMHGTRHFLKRMSKCNRHETALGQTCWMERRSGCEENCTGELTAYHCIIHQETLCGKVLKIMITVTLNHCQFLLIQMELQCNGTLKGKYDTEWPAQFISSIPEAMPQLRLHAAQTLYMLSFIFSGACPSIRRSLMSSLQKGSNLKSSVVV
uniref:DUF4371 domain-containing protein n=1 Tax=Oreochromis aureus TaxID=47969 RepID=A0A668UY73_OREAU